MSWGLGFEIQQKDNRVYIMHGGDNTGFHSFSAATSNGHFGYVIMTNGENGSVAVKKLMMDDPSWCPGGKNTAFRR
jgi:hypothetical protein